MIILDTEKKNHNRLDYSGCSREIIQQLHQSSSLDTNHYLQAQVQIQQVKDFEIDYCNLKGIIKALRSQRQIILSRAAKN